ncbi:MAG: T9SS type A sorting domain-containing protein [Phycisphaerae bacterium]|nr:T9SS type A sorting domain-containing protein [Saprospiraceae bacterium]
MKKCFLFCCLFCSLTLHTQILTKIDSFQIPQAQIWGVISSQGDSIVLTTTFTPTPGGKPHIFLRKVSFDNIHQQSQPKQITFDSDFQGITNLTDHKHLVLNGEIFVAFSTQGDKDLYLFKTDLNGNRIGQIQTVVTNSSAPTNDMTLVSDGQTVSVKWFMPPNSWVRRYQPDLSPLGPAQSANAPPHNNLGNACFHDGKFYFFSGDKFGYNAKLVLAQFNADWSQAVPQQTLIPSASDGNFFASGVARDPETGRWFVGFAHLSNSQQIGQEHIDIAVFDQNFALLDRQHVTGAASYRPHFVFRDGFLFVSYDQVGAHVRLEKYVVENPSGTNDGWIQSGFQIFPNPFSESLQVAWNGSERCNIRVFSAGGRLVLQNHFLTEKTFDTHDWDAGVYFIEICGEWRKVFKR